MKSVLVVDDCIDIHQLLRGYLLRSSTEVLSAYSGMEAYALLKSTRVDLIVCDLQMEAGDGLWLISKLEQMRYEKPLLVFTSNPDLAPLVKHRQFNVFSKENAKDLIRKIENILSSV